jgi:hypothetical protein
VKRSGVGRAIEAMAGRKTGTYVVPLYQCGGGHCLTLARGTPCRPCVAGSVLSTPSLFCGDPKKSLTALAGGEEQDRQ